MALYFLLGTLGTEGNRMTTENENLVREEAARTAEGSARVLGQYDVLGHYDMLVMVEADGNQDVARLSANLGARCGVRFETLSAVNADLKLPDTGSGRPSLTTAATAEMPSEPLNVR